MQDKIHVTMHSLQRYVERVEKVSLKEARRRIMACERAILSAAAIGCSRVVMPCRATLVLVGATVVTVRPVERKRSPAVGNGRNRGMRAADNGKGRKKWNAEREQEKW